MVKKGRNKAGLIAVVGIVLAVAILVAIGIGSVRFSPLESLLTLIGQGDDRSNTILWDIRIPRVLLALIIGANLAASGALLQAVMLNPLADPGLTGVSSGAAVAALFIMLVVPGYSSFIPIAAIAGGGFAAVMVYAMAWKRVGGFTPIRIILSGVAINAVFGGVIGLLSILYSDRLPAALQWLNGSLNGKGMGDVMVILPYSIVGWIAALFCVRKANVLRLGEQTAHHLGQNMNQVRFVLSLVAVYLAAVSVSTVGLVGFVGLVVPHIARLLIGSDYRFSMPLGLMLGAIVLLVADTAGRSLFSPLQIPAGIIMAIAGGPYFLYLMRRGGA
ncbi:iron ABC transporter permease [Paenibacillus pinisoli]|uniref:Iron ABC transporter permease n=1 Tax=Paenibacillus pinisoli TaxID=1276110 RepID=A0A3A6PLJ9_9BACL|nr:iron ABC transporter permease [Paenibacillus pinisoli]RJX37271.1 iron ABC transporter permease [Paenibacillus pinisoli]